MTRKLDRRWLEMGVAAGAIGVTGWITGSPAIAAAVVMTALATDRARKGCSLKRSTGAEGSDPS